MSCLLPVDVSKMQAGSLIRWRKKAAAFADCFLGSMKKLKTVNVLIILHFVFRDTFKNTVDTTKTTAFGRN